MPSWDDVVEIGKRFPGVEVSTWYGRPALKAGGKGFCALRTDPDALVVMVPDLDDKEALLQGDPDVFFTTPHYDGYAFVLVHVEKVDADELAELIEDAWRTRAPKKLVTEYEAAQ